MFRDRQELQVLGSDAQHVPAAVMPMVPLGGAAHEKVVCLASLAVEVERSVSASQLEGRACPRPAVGGLRDEAPKPLIFRRARGALRSGVKAAAPLQSLVVHQADLPYAVWRVGRVRVAGAFVNGARRIISSESFARRAHLVANPIEPLGHCAQRNTETLSNIGNGGATLVDASSVTRSARVHLLSRPVRLLKMLPFVRHETDCTKRKQEMEL